MPHGYIRPLSLISQDFGVPVVMYDQIGCGESTRFKDRKGDEAFWTREMFIAELENVISQLGIQQFDLLGHSWGGSLATLFAATKQPEGLRKLIVMNTASDLGKMKVASDRLRKDMPPSVQEVLNQAEAKDSFDTSEEMEAMIYAYILHGCRVQPWPQEMWDLFAAMAEDNTVYSTMMGSSPMTMKGPIARDSGWVERCFAALTRESVPGGLMLVTSEFDLATDECFPLWFTQTKCCVKWVKFALSSHFVMFEETEAVVKAIGAFLKDGEYD